MSEIEYFTTWSCPRRHMTSLAMVRNETYSPIYFSKAIIKSLEKNSIKHAVMAIAKRRVIAVWRFEFSKSTLYSRHTIVMRNLRHGNIATQMWEIGLRAWRPKSVEVTVESHGGAALIRRMIQAHPKISFSVRDQRYEGKNFWEEFAYKLMNRA